MYIQDLQEILERKNSKVILVFDHMKITFPSNTVCIQPFQASQP